MTIDRLDNRLVGFFDILGFSSALKTRSIGDIHKIYSDLIDEFRSKIFNPQTMAGSQEPVQVRFALARIIFDSIVLVSEPIVENKSIANFLIGAIRLMEASFVRRLPLRGAIGTGDVLVDEDRSIILSSAFPSLVKAEKKSRLVWLLHIQE